MAKVNKSRELVGRKCSRGEIKYAYKVLATKSEARRPTGRPRRGCEHCLRLLKWILNN